LLKLIVEPQSRAGERAKTLIQAARMQIADEATQQEILELIAAHLFKIKSSLTGKQPNSPQNSLQWGVDEIVAGLTPQSQLHPSSRSAS
jgi:siroheme synthase